MNIQFKTDADLSSTKLVLFDCDGTLLESETLMSDVQVRRLNALGIPCTAADLAIRYSGASTAAMIADLSQRFGTALDVSVFQTFERDFRARIDLELEPVEGAVELLSRMPVQFCLASNAPRFRLINMLRATGLLSVFGPRIVSAHDTDAAKPEPDVFLLAAELMGVDPSDCLVVEDSLFGLTAARAAGMRTAVYLGASHQRPEMTNAVLAAKPDHVLESLTDLLSILPTQGAH